MRPGSDSIWREQVNWPIKTAEGGTAFWTWAAGWVLQGQSRQPAARMSFLRTWNRPPCSSRGSIRCQIGSACATRQLDWRRDSLGERFDMILGSDILYERKEWEFLERFWREHLLPGGSVLLGEPGRQTGDLFIPWIDLRGWRLERFAEAVPSRTRPIRLFRITRGSSIS